METGVRGCVTLANELTDDGERATHVVMETETLPHGSSFDPKFVIHGLVFGPGSQDDFASLRADR